MGRLSNPSDAVRRLILQESDVAEPSRNVSREATKQDLHDKSVVSNEEKGQLSNPVQKRLPASIVDDLVNDYVGGLSINALARRYAIHRTTVMRHLKFRGVERRQSVCKLSEASVAQAATLYSNGLSLAKTAKEFGVNEGTITRYFRSAGLPIRPRKGWK